MNALDIRIRHLGLQDYERTWRRMQVFTEQRKPSALDEIWVLEHPPVYTQGMNGKSKHIINPGNIPIVKTDRGGQITYHGPGQLILYTLIDLRRRALGIRGLVSALEEAAINTLSQYAIRAKARPEAPGVYVQEKKIASIGLRIRKGCSYHGMSFNVSMDLSPFEGINICGYPMLGVTQLADCDGPENLMEVSLPLIHQLMKILDYSPIL